MVLAAVTQLTSTPVIRDNLATAVSLIHKAAKAGAKAVFLPEATDFVAPSESVQKLTYSQDNADFVSGILRAARESSVFVSVGIHEPADEAQRKADEEEGKVKPGGARCFNTQLIVDDKGEIQSRYRKVHLFDVDIQGKDGIQIKESDTTIPGSRLEEPVPSPVGTLGSLTCYDMRFAEAALQLRRRGAQVLTYPSAFAVRTGPAHWETLLRARAIETQSYVVAAAQVGTHPETGRSTWGHALVVDPWGTVISQCSDMQPYKPSFALAEIDLENVEPLRREMPLWQQRRSKDGVYPEL
ncbi:unnamed protein product [Parajaminaea phylloscopi]